jgi:FtsZ-binding cell division protein ZapB
MNSLEILQAKINLKTTILKFTNSIEELQEKHPERKDLIDSLLDSLDDVARFQSVFMELENEYHLECKTNFRLQLEISQLKHEQEKLQKDLKDCKKML